MLPGSGAEVSPRVRLNLIGGQDAGWVNALRAAAADRVSIVAVPPGGRVSPLWRRLSREILGEAIAIEPAVDASSATSSVGDGMDEHWQFEDGNGQPLFAPFFAARDWQREPFSMLLRLVACRGQRRLILAEACIGTRDSYAELLQQLARTAVILLKQALSGSPPECAPVAEAPLAARREGVTDWLIGGLRRQQLRNSRRLAVETWAVGIVERPIGQVLKCGELGPATWLVWDDREGYLADPFPWPGRTDRIVCERYSNRTRRGDLVAVEGRDACHPIQIEIPERRHLSYPGAWLEGDHVLLMPESGASRATVIYRLDAKARAVPFVTVAEDIGMADPTLFKRGGLYWIAYTDTDIGLHDNLCLMVAERMTGPWRRHPGNPVKLDVRSSRPAGAVFRVGEGWFRPAQDCAADYGAALAINRIVELSTTRFREEVVAVLRPDPQGPYPHGLHTLSIWGDRLLIDGKRWQRRPQLLADKLLYRLRRNAGS